jgi:hypothetical protein
MTPERTQILARFWSSRKTPRGVDERARPASATADQISNGPEREDRQGAQPYGAAVLLRAEGVIE